MELEILDPLPQNIFLMEQKGQVPNKLGLLCLSVLCTGHMFFGIPATVEIEIAGIDL